MDKTDFIRLIQMARKNAATEKNIRHAWQKSGLFPIQPHVVLDKLRLKPLEEPLEEAFEDSSEELPSNTLTDVIATTPNSDDSILLPRTPANVKQVDALV